MLVTVLYIKCVVYVILLWEYNIENGKSDSILYITHSQEIYSGKTKFNCINMNGIVT